MASYTAQLILSEPTHNSKTAMYSKGDIVAIYELINEAPNPDGRLCFVHVDNVPNDIDFINLGVELSRPEYNNVTATPELTNRRAWMVKLDELTDYQKLLDTKVINIDWSIAVNAFIRKFDGMTGGEYYAGLEI